MSFGKNTAPRLCALFAAVAMAAAPALAAPLPQPRIASPQQMQQYNDLAAELAAREAPYILLQQKFDLGQLSAAEYRDAVAALDAKQGKIQPTTTLPDILRPHITGCTKDGYSVNIPLNVTLGTGDFSKDFDPRQPRGAAATQMLLRLDQSLQVTIRNTNVHLITTATKDQVVTAAFKTAIDAALAKFSTDMSAQTRVDVKVQAQEIQTASMANCLIQPDQATAPAGPQP